MEKLQSRGSIGWSRIPIQLGGGVVVTALLPYATRLLLGIKAGDLQILQSTMIGVIIATIIAVWFTRHIATYPGEEAVASLLPSFGLAYGVVFSVFVLGRLQYNRVNLVLGLVFGLVWMFATGVLAQRKRVRIGLLPFGDISGLMAVQRVQWVVLKSPDILIDDVDAIAADLRTDLPNEWDKCLADYALARTPVYHTKHLLESLTGRVELEHLSENSFGSLAPRAAYMAFKHGLDWIAAALLGLLLLPVLILVGLAVRLTSRGPALFIQERIGYLGKSFLVYKFRTMRVGVGNDHDLRSAAITQVADKRVTPLGRRLRSTRLDELPQLLNILKGEMSFIGPRPEAAVLSRWYEEQIPFYRYRHIIRPGIAGWAQVCQGHVADVEEVRSKLYYDFYYIKQYSPWIDMLIVVRTIRTMLTGFGSK